MIPGQLGPISVAGLALEVADHSHGIHDRDALGDAGNDVYTGVHGLHDGVGCEGRGNEDERGVRAGLGDGLLDGVVHRHVVVEHLAAASGRDSGHQVGAVLTAAQCVETALASCDALHHQSCVPAYQYAHLAAPVGSIRN